MHNPMFYERQRMRSSTWNIPRFLYSYDETLDGGLILPRGMLDTVTSLAAQAGRQPPRRHRRTDPGHAAGVHVHRDAHERPARGGHRLGTYW